MDDTILNHLYKKLLFEHCIFKGRWTLSIEDLKTYSPEMIERMIRSELMMQLVYKIIHDHYGQLQTRYLPEGFAEYSMDLLVIDKGRLKDIVEGCILTMTDEQLYNLRKGQSDEMSEQLKNELWDLAIKK